MTYITKLHPEWPRVLARVQFVVESPDGTETLSYGEVELDIQMVSLMPPTEYAVRHLWPAFVGAANAAKVTLPRLYGATISKTVPELIEAGILPWHGR